MDPLGFAWESVIILECSMIDGSVVAVSGTVVIVWLIKAIVFRSKLPSFAQIMRVRSDSEPWQTLVRQSKPVFDRKCKGKKAKGTVEEP